MQSFAGLLIFAVAVLRIIGEVECNNLISGSERRGLLVTTAKKWVTGVPQQVCITSQRLATVVVTVTVCQSSNVGDVFNATEVVVSAADQSDVIVNKCVPLTIENDTVSAALLLVRARNQGNEEYQFAQNATISVGRQEVTTFIETDKSIYKPSDTVRIRLLSVRGPEARLVTDRVSLVYVEDPTGTRVAQWSDVETNNGLVQMELPLSSEPSLGTWKIRSNHNGGRFAMTSFEVKEYVLPKFQVDIAHPSKMYYGEEMFKWRVCARYTYGEPVFGRVADTSVCLTGLHDHGLSPPPPCITYNNTLLSDGCAEFNASSSTLQLPIYQWRLSTTRVTLSAAVKERGTDVVLNASHVINLLDQRYTLKLSATNRPFFKPGINYNAMGSVLTADTSTGVQAAIRVEVTTGQAHHGNEAAITNQIITSDANGRFEFMIPGNVLMQYSNSTLSIRVKLPDDTRFQGLIQHMTLTPWYSPSSSYLQIHSPDDTTIACAASFSIPFTYISDGTSTTNESLLFIYQIISRGNIVSSDVIASVATQTQTQGSHLGPSHQLELHITPEMSGSFDLTVFHIRSDGETVGDTAHVSVNQCFEHQVRMNFASEKVQPGHVSSIDVTADEMSLCAVGVVDKSVELMGKSTWLSASKVDETRVKYHQSRGYNDHHSFPCQVKSRQQTEEEDPDEIDSPGLRRYRGHRRHPFIDVGMSRYLDTTMAFHYAGVVTLTDLVVDSRPCQSQPARRYDYMLLSAPSGRRGVGLPQRQASVAAIQPDDMDRPIMATMAKMATPFKSPSAVQHRTFFPETWLWQLENIGKTTRHLIPVTLPHTITEWIGGGYCINAQSGVGIAEPFRVTAFQPFFVSFTLPYSLVRGESVVIPVTVFNYLSNQCLKVTLNVANSTSFELKKVNPKSQLSPDLAQLKVCGRQSETHSFRLVARQLGNINFTVLASSEPSSDEESNTIDNSEQATASDAITQQILVKSEGKEEEYARSAYTCATSDNSFESTGNWSLQLPDDVISDSVRTRINVIGDVMGSALSDLDKLLALPTGCGEQNMLKFAPNIYVLDYLTQTEQLTENIKVKALGFLQTGYQRELTYRHSDGSYSAFGMSDPEGSIWLTAFVVRSFARAQPYIFIDSDSLEMSINWIKNQQMENGCFRSVGRVLHKDMTGGLQHDDSHVALTSYIVISLLEANISVTDPSIVNAFRCIRQQSVDDVYTLSLISYAYALYGRDVIDRNDVTSRLEEKSVRTGGMKYWRSDRARDDDVSHYMTSSSAVDIEMTSYILLSILRGQEVEAESNVHNEAQIVRWLTSQRNAYGGFSSTQDTILALQALSRFATKVFRSARDLDLKDTILALQALSWFATKVFRSARDLDLKVTVSNQGQRQPVDYYDDTILALQALSRFATKVFRSARDLDLKVTVSNQGQRVNHDDDTILALQALSRFATKVFRSARDLDLKDTILALQALSRFATKVFRSARDLDLKEILLGLQALQVLSRFDTVSDQALQALSRLRVPQCQGRKNCRQVQFDVNGSNRLVQQSADGELKLPTPVYYTLNGFGCALVQVAVKYNRVVMSRDQPMDVFLLDVSVDPIHSASCTAMKLNICARYNGADTASNMAIVAVNMVSGWIPDKMSISKLKHNALFGVKRVDIEKNVVNFYFDEFNKSQRCFSFKVLQDIVVLNTKPGLVHIYDYYTPGTSVFAKYNLSTTNCSSKNSAASSLQLPPPTGRKRQNNQAGASELSVAQTSAGEATTVTRQNRRRQNNRNDNSDSTQRNGQCPVCFAANQSTTAQQRFTCNSSAAYRVNIIAENRMEIVRTFNRTTMSHTATSSQSSFRALSARCRCQILSTGSQILVLTSNGDKLRVRPGAKVDLRASNVTIVALTSDSPLNDITAGELWSSC